MKNLFKRMNVSVVAILLGFGLIALQSAFTPVKEKRVDAFWRYDSNDPDLARSGFEYEPITTDPDEETCPNGEDMPCVIAVPQEITSQEDLDDYLHLTYGTPEEVTGDAYSTKIEL